MFLEIPLRRGNTGIVDYFFSNYLIGCRSKRTTTATKKPVKGQTQPRSSIAGKKAEISKQKNNSNSNMRMGTANKRATTNGVSNSNPSEDVKEEFVKVKEDVEEEKKFEAGNHMEVDLVDMLGNGCIQELNVCFH